jgi:hypothetical protein
MMKIPVVRGVIDRRILVNYRVNPEILASRLPAPFRPKLVHGTGMAGICLIRLRNIRPAFLPSWIGIASENAAHRAAVEWEENGAPRQGVFVWRRDTSHWFNVLAGGRIFPGVHHHSKFTVSETTSHLRVSLRSDDGLANMAVSCRHTKRFAPESIFESLEEASGFFQSGALGYSPLRESARFQGLELHCVNWSVQPLLVESVRSSFFEDKAIFPQGSMEFDSALFMQGIDHEWRGSPDLCVDSCDGVPSNHQALCCADR